LKLDPLSSLVAAWAGRALYCVGEAEEAIDIIRKAIAMDPDHWQLYWHRGLGYLYVSMEREAGAALETAVDLSGGASAVLALLAAAYYSTGKRGEADRVAERLKERSNQTYVAPLLFAWICVARGEPTAALAHVERAIRERDSWIDFNAVMPPRIRVSGPGIDAMLKKAGLH
jgi:tetratricopeptide (TPR) repeat protein